MVPSEEHARNIARIITGVYSNSNVNDKRQRTEQAIDLYWEEIAMLLASERGITRTEERKTNERLDSSNRRP